MPGASQFFGDNAGLHPLSILILWLISSLVLTLPWVWLLLTPGIQAAWALPIGLCLTALLPTGVVNPLTVAGVLFPGVGWAGLIATIILFGTLSKYRLYSILSAAILAAICYISHPDIPTLPPAWQGYDTELGGSELSKQQPMALYKAVVYVQETALDSNAQIQVFPEGIINHWTPSAEGFWQSTFSELEQNHQSILSARKKTCLTAVNITTSFSCAASTPQLSNSGSRSHTPCGDLGTTSASPFTTSARRSSPSVPGARRPSSATSSSSLLPSSSP